MDIIREIEVKNEEIKTALVQATQIFIWLRSCSSGSLITDNGVNAIDSWLENWAASEKTLGPKTKLAAESLDLIEKTPAKR